MAILLLSGCGLIQMGNNEQYSSNNEAASPVSGKKAAYILNMPKSEIFELCAESCVETAKRLGMSYDVSYSEGDDEAFKKQITDCAENGYDGLFLSHGGEAYSFMFLSDLLKEYPELKIVTFDTQFKDENGEIKTILYMTHQGFRIICYSSSGKIT